MHSSVKSHQRTILKRLLKKAIATSFGKKFNFDQIDNYEQFVNHIPVQIYSDIEPNIERLKKGHRNLYWPGTIDKYAVSAGTSGKGKHIPITGERLTADRRFMRKIATSYFKQRPNPLQIIGTHLSMPGSVERIDGNLIGEVSGLTAINAPSWLRVFQLESPEKLTRLSFKEKFNLLLQRSIDANVKVITAAPSWILTLFQQILKQTGKQKIIEVWPNLKLLVCGGLKLDSYRSHLQKLIGNKKIDFIETYGASEGYVGFSDTLSKKDLKMVIDNGIFFECIPNPLPDEKASGIQKTLPLWKVETGIPYGLLVTTNAGLWRYPLNDIIEFTSLNPLRFEVKGRVNEMLDDYGEALFIYEAEQALMVTAEAFDLNVGNFTIAATLKNESVIPLHRWFIQFTQPVHSQTLQKMSKFIDEKLQQINRHYAIRRETDALGAPEIHSITQSDINRWLESQGKNKAQGKLPKILKERVSTLKPRS